MHGSSGLTGFRSVSFGRVRCGLIAFWFESCCSLLGLFEGFGSAVWIGLRKKRFDRNWKCCRMHRLNRTDWLSSLFNNKNRNNLCGYV